MGLVWWCLLLLGRALLLFQADCDGSITHSLLFIYTSALEPGQEQPKLFSVANLDGYLASFYDSNARRIVPRASWMKNLEEDSPQYWDSLTQRALIGERRFKGDLMNLQKYYNQSGGHHILQSVIGCELPEDGRSVGYYQYGYNGRDFISFDKETLTWTAADTQAQMAQRKLNTDLARSQIIKFHLENQCVEELQKFLEYGKEALSKNATGRSHVGVILGVTLGTLAVLIAVGTIFYFKIPQGGYITSTRTQTDA